LVFLSLLMSRILESNSQILSVSSLSYFMWTAIKVISCCFFRYSPYGKQFQKMGRFITNSILHYIQVIVQWAVSKKIYRIMVEIFISCDSNLIDVKQEEIRPTNLASILNIRYWSVISVMAHSDRWADKQDLIVHWRYQDSGKEL
jgi:hypothetical protein